VNVDDRSDAPVVGYMCLTDYWHELGEAPHGNKVYPSLDDIRCERKCVSSCGIAEVEVRLLKIVQEPEDAA
jgi:hypothetical protein